MKEPQCTSCPAVNKAEDEAILQHLTHDTWRRIESRILYNCYEPQSTPHGRISCPVVTEAESENIVPLIADTQHLNNNNICIALWSSNVNHHIHNCKLPLCYDTNAFQCTPLEEPVIMSCDLCSWKSAQTKHTPCTIAHSLSRPRIQRRHLHHLIQSPQFIEWWCSMWTGKYTRLPFSWAVGHMT